MTAASSAKGRPCIHAAAGSPNVGTEPRSANLTNVDGVTLDGESAVDPET